MLQGWASSISSSIRPQDLTATVWPPIGLPEPGLITNEVTPPANASENPWSAGLIASSALIRAPTGLVSSLVSLPSQPMPSSCTPTWACDSTKPGSTQLPVASITSIPSGTSRPAPIALIRPSVTITVPPAMGSPVTGTT